MKMKPRATIDALEEEISFYINENDSPPDLADIEMDEQEETMVDVPNDLECAIDEEANEFQGADDEQ